MYQIELGLGRGQAGQSLGLLRFEQCRIQLGEWLPFGNPVSHIERQRQDHPRRLGHDHHLMFRCDLTIVAQHASRAD